MPTPTITPINSPPAPQTPPKNWSGIRLSAVVEAEYVRALASR